MLFGSTGTVAACLNGYWAFALKRQALANEVAIAKLHTCFDKHRAQSIELLKSIATTDDARDIRNEMRTGGTPIISPAPHDAESMPSHEAESMPSHEDHPHNEPPTQS